MNGRDSDNLPLAQALTEREQEVLTHIGDGLTNRAIAEQMTVALSTVKWYARQIYNKLGVEGRQEAVARGRRLGLLAPEAGPRHNLPPQPTPFIGRQAEIETLTRLLVDEACRLLTISGPGGIGKTRLALVVGEQYVGGAVREPSLPFPFPDGIFFVTLAPLSTAGQIATAMATALDFPLESGQPTRTVEQQIADYLRRKQVLLILDNYEHLLPNTSWLASLLAAAPHVKVIVTSRERLHLQEEYLFPLDGLTYPESEALARAADDPVKTFSALALFVTTARRLQTDYEVAAADLPALVELCRLVEGMPLALELAAGRLDVLPLATIAGELQRDVGLLATRLRNVPARHRHIFAAFAATWQRLKAEEQGIFAGLSIFRGGFTRAAARQICAPEMNRGEFWLALSRLSSKSLIRYHPEADRYDLHELLRQFAAEKLSQAPEVEAAVRDRHSAYYCAFLHEHTENWHTGQQLETLSTVTCESDNAQVAWRWAREQEEWQRLVQAIDSWGWFHVWQGRFADGESFCQTIIEKAKRQLEETATSPDYLRLWARALSWLVWFTHVTVQQRRALRRLQQSLALLERPELADQDTRREKAFVILLEGMIALDQDLQEARQLLKQSLDLYQELGNQWGTAAGLRVLGLLDLRTGNYDSGLERVEAALSIHRERGDRREQGACMATLSIIHRTLGHLEEAERLERAALRLNQQIGDRSPLVVRHANLAFTLLWQGKFAEAQQLASESLAICRDLGHRAAEGGPQYCLCEILMHSGQYEQAGRQVAAGLLVVQATSDRRHEGALYGVLGQLALVESSYAEAQAAFAKSGEIFRELQYHIIDISAAALGYTACRLGRPQETCQHLVEALASALNVKSYIRVVFALPAVALLLAQTGAVERALKIWALAKCQPFVANSRWFEDVAGRELEALAATLPAEVAEAAQEHGRALDLWPTAAELLEELAVELLDKDGR